MKKWFIFLLILLFTLAFLGQVAFADEILENKMDFSAAVKYSLEHNNNIRAMRKNLSASEKDIGIERSLLMPKVRLLEGFTATSNPTDALALKLNQSRTVANDLSLGTLNYPGTVTNFLTSGLIEQPLYNRKASIAIKMAKKEYSANGYTYLRRQEELVNQVAQAYLIVSADKELIKMIELTIKDANENLLLAEERLKGGKGLPSDALRAKAFLDEAQQRLISAQRSLNVAKRKLGLLLGLEEEVEISSAVPDIQLQEINYYKNFSIYRNDIKATELRVQNAKNNIQSAQADWFPTLNALASYSFYNQAYPFGGEGQNYTAGAVFRWDAFDGNKRKYEILKAKDKEIEAKEYLTWLRKTVAFQVYETYSNVEEHQKNLELAKEVLKAAEQDRALVFKRWKTSDLPYVSMVDAQANLDRARINIVNISRDLKEDLILLSYESGIIYQELALN